MTSTDGGPLPEADLTNPPVMSRRSVLRGLLQDPVGIACLAILAILVGASLLAPLLTSHNPIRSSLADTLAPMSQLHPLGGDGVGRDVLARLLYGGRTTLAGALVAVGVALGLGVPAGLISGYYRGWFDAIANWIVNLVMSVPAIIVLLVVMAMVSQDIYVAMAVLGVILSPGTFRLIRASATSVREELYVDAARVSGLSDPRIMRRHILPVVRTPTIIQAAEMYAISIGIQAGMAFLGLGSALQPSWGAMLNDAFTNIYRAPILLLWPGLAIGLTIAALSLLGNSVRDQLSGATRRTAARRRSGTGTAEALRRPGRSAERLQVSEDHAAPCPDQLLVVEGLTVAYPGVPDEAVVVDDVSITVARGEVLGLVGESGSGKTQTAFAILGLLPAEARAACSRMQFDGDELTQMNPAARARYRGRRIAYVPQEPMSNLDPSFRIGSQLVEPMRRHLSLGKSEAKARALDLLDRVGIPDPRRVCRAYPHEISGGMAQRVLIAGAVSCDPDLLIADEPTTALDVTIQAEVLDLLRSLQGERGMGLLFVTHDFGVVADICDRVAVMQNGRVVEEARARHLFSAPEHAYTRLLLDSTLEDAEPRPARAAAGATAASQEGEPA